MSLMQNTVNEDNDYVIVNSIPLLCISCDLPLTLSIDSVTLVTNAAGAGTSAIALPAESLIHVAPAGEQADASR